MEQVFFSLNKVKNQEEQERLVCTLVLGLYSALKQGALTTDDLWELFFKHSTIQILRRLGLRNQLLQLIHAGMELEDIQSIIPEHFPKALDDLIDEINHYMRSLPRKKDPLPYWLSEEDKTLSLLQLRQKRLKLLQELFSLKPLPDDEAYAKISAEEREALLDRALHLLAHLELCMDASCLEALLGLFSYGEAWSEVNQALMNMVGNLVLDDPTLKLGVQHALRTGTPGTRKAVIDLITRWLEPQNYLEDVLQALQDQMERVRESAVWAVLRLGNSDYLPRLEAMQADPSPHVRKAAEEAVKSLRTEELRASSD